MLVYKTLQYIKPKNPHTRLIFTTSNLLNNTQTEEKNRWNCVVKEAERVVGYPTSFLSLRWILNDEVANIASHIRKLIGTNHPLLQTAKSLLVRNELPTWGLIVLLISKTAGLNAHFTELECDRTADILHSQRILAEVTEMIKTSHLMHKGLININPETEDASDLNFGNKLALLSGDYLLSTCFLELARMKNFDVQETISSTLRDLAESEFVGLRDDQNRPLPSRPLSVQEDVMIPLEFGANPFRIQDVLGNMKAEWTLRNVLGGGTLLGKCCQCSLMLAHHKPQLQEFAYIFGRNLALAWQARLEKDLFKEGKFNLVSAPVMLHLEHDPRLYKEIEKGLVNVDNVDFDFVRKAVLAGPGLEKTVKLKEEFAQNAFSVLNQFSDSDSKNSLVNIVESL